ncbi:unnamed protein product [Heterobilharzia americana]|nr:unnamed protein product [Heterobilharzia americana]
MNVELSEVAAKSAAVKLTCHTSGYRSTWEWGISRSLWSIKNSSLYWCIAPVRLKTLSEKGIHPIKAACGYGFTTYICESSYSDFCVYGCGINSDGQLGYQSTGIEGKLSSGDLVNVVPEPVKLDICLTNTEKKTYRPSHVACGRAHTIISYENFKESTESTPPLIFSLGNNVFGQCGREMIAGEKYGQDTGVVTKIFVPPEIKSVKKIVCGQDHSMLLSSDGVVYSCGLGSDGQTGLGHYDPVDRFTPVKGALMNERVCLLSSRGDTVLALTESNKLYAWGNNEYGQIWPFDQNVQVAEPVHLNLDHCIVPTESNVSADSVHIGEVQSIACAGSMCCIVNKIGQVFVWGYGCIGLGPKVNFSPRPTLIPPGLFMPAVVDSPSRVNYISAGLHHFIVQNTDGLLWAWGAPRGGLYCLGLGTQVSKNADNQTYPMPLLLPIKSTRVACGVDHTVKCFYQKDCLFITVGGSNFGTRFIRRQEFERRLCEGEILGHHNNFIHKLYIVASLCSFAWDKHNAYEILGVNKSATIDEIKSAYYTLSKNLHPDRLAHSNPDKMNNEEFQLLSAAYMLLKNTETRSQYDQYIRTRCWIQQNKNDIVTDFDAEFLRARELFMRRQRSRSDQFRYKADVIDTFKSQVKTNMDPLRVSNYRHHSFKRQHQQKESSSYLLRYNFLAVTLSIVLIYFMSKLK